MIRLALLSILLASAALADDTMPLTSSAYKLTLTHEAKHPSVHFPGDAIPDDDYRVLKERKTLKLQFSEDRKQVEILQLGISGEIATADAKRRVYHLNNGVAGGELFIESTATGLEATFTEFGSGVPVTSSMRGELKPEIPKGP